MSEPPLVRVEHVSKKFCRSLRRSLWYGLRDLGTELLGRAGDDRLRLRQDEFLAVDDVSFELRRGECLGLIGANGAGKSTLLKMLNGLVRPDAGKIEIRGRVGALIELGAGFNPILTGRENVYVNGAVLGLTKKEIDAKFDAIVEFAELREFIDTPVQSYSSGMRVRLGFAVAAHLEPDVLLIDEVLAVGDVAFRSKCLSSIAELSRTAAVVFVSHHMALVAMICTRVASMKSGRLHDVGSESAQSIRDFLATIPLPARRATGSDKIALLAMQASSGAERNDRGALEMQFGADLELEIELSVAPETPRFFVRVVLISADERAALECDSRRSSFSLGATDARIALHVKIPEVQLNEGRYTISVYCVELRPDGGVGPILHADHHCGVVTLRDGFHNFAAFQPRADWAIR
jgi:lipopolysaccharide transport system ATP-binding protein